MRTALFALMGGLMGLPVWAVQPVLVDHRHVDLVPAYSAAQMERVAQFTWYFAHASVGDNLVDGISELHTNNPNFYLLDHFQYFGHDRPPTTVSPGVIYDHQRWNPGWQAKVTMFETNVASVWHSPKAHLAINKFCYIDIYGNADPLAYLRSLRALEAAYPDTIFVYMTMPETAVQDKDDARRYAFNQVIRDWTQAHGRVLFDLADIETYDPAGVMASFTLDGAVYPYLNSVYTKDGTHLNDDAGLGRQRGALGFYALANALFEADRNNDGMTDGAQVLAGNSPIAGLFHPSVDTLSVTQVGPQAAVLTAQIAPHGEGDVDGWLYWAGTNGLAQRMPLAKIADQEEPVRISSCATGLVAGVAYTAWTVVTNAFGATTSSVVSLTAGEVDSLSAGNSWAHAVTGVPLDIPASNLLAQAQGDGLQLAWVAPVSAAGVTVRWIPDAIRYTAPEPLAQSGELADQVAFAVVDGAGHADLGWLFVAVHPTNALPYIVSAQFTATSQLLLNGLGVPGRPYQIQIAASLSPPAWAALGTVTAQADGRLTFLTGTTGSQAFYRAINF